MCWSAPRCRRRVVPAQCVRTWCAGDLDFILAAAPVVSIECGVHVHLFLRRVSFVTHCWSAKIARSTHTAPPSPFSHPLSPPTSCVARRTPDPRSPSLPRPSRAVQCPPGHRRPPCTTDTHADRAHNHTLNHMPEGCTMADRSGPSQGRPFPAAHLMCPLRCSLRPPNPPLTKRTTCAAPRQRSSWRVARA